MTRFNAWSILCCLVVTVSGQATEEDPDNGTTVTGQLLTIDDKNGSTVDPVLNDVSTPALKRRKVCCPAGLCRPVHWPVALERGFHAPLTDHFGIARTPIFRSRRDYDDEQCRWAAAGTIRGKIKYRLPSIMSHLSLIDRASSAYSKDANAGISVLFFATSFDYYRFLTNKLSLISNVDLALIDYYSDRDDLLHLLKTVIDSETAWFRMEAKFEIAHYNLSINQQSILSDRFVTAFNQYFKFLLFEDEGLIQADWWRLFQQFGTHWPASGTLGGVYALYGAIDCDRSWAKQFDSVTALKRCLQDKLQRGLFSDRKSNLSDNEWDLCQNLTRASPIRGHPEVSGGSDRVRERIVGEAGLDDIVDTLRSAWWQSLREWPSLIRAEMKPICDLIDLVLRSEEGSDYSPDQAIKWRNSCLSALEGYMAQEGFTGQVIDYGKELIGEDTTNRYTDQCGDHLKRTRLVVPIPDHYEEGTVLVALRYDYNGTVCARMNRWAVEGQSSLCPILKAEMAAVARAESGKLSPFAIFAIVALVGTGTVLAIVAALKTLPAF